MHRYAFLPFLPFALGCANPNSNACASYISANKAVASPFCASFTAGAAVTATTALPAWATNCSNKPSQISKECSCYWTGSGAQPTTPPSGGTPTTLATQTTKVTAPSGVTTTLPKSAGAVATNKAIVVPAGQTLDGGMKNYDRNRESFFRGDGIGMNGCMWLTMSQRVSAPSKTRLARTTPCLSWRRAPLLPMCVS